jgi:hypothetical protein
VRQPVAPLPTTCDHYAKPNTSASNEPPATSTAGPQNYPDSNADTNATTTSPNTTETGPPTSPNRLDNHRSINSIGQRAATRRKNPPQDHGYRPTK